MWSCAHVSHFEKMSDGFEVCTCHMLSCNMRRACASLKGWSPKPVRCAFISSITSRMQNMGGRCTRGLFSLGLFLLKAVRFGMVSPWLLQNSCITNHGRMSPSLYLSKDALAYYSTFSSYYVVTSCILHADCGLRRCICERFICVHQSVLAARLSVASYA